VTGNLSAIQERARFRSTQGSPTVGTPTPGFATPPYYKTLNWDNGTRVDDTNFGCYILTGLAGPSVFLEEFQLCVLGR
jgi:hypothetical protein